MGSIIVPLSALTISYFMATGMDQLGFQEVTDIWPDPIFVPKVAIA